MHRHLMNDASCGILSETSMIWCMCVWCRYLVLSSSQNFTLLELNLHQHFCQCWRALALWRNTSHTHTHLLDRICCAYAFVYTPWWWPCKVWNMCEEHQWQEVVYYWLCSLLARILCNSWSSMYITTEWVPSLVARIRCMGFSREQWTNSSL